MRFVELILSENHARSEIFICEESFRMLENIKAEITDTKSGETAVKGKISS